MKQKSFARFGLLFTAVFLVSCSNGILTHGIPATDRFPAITNPEQLVMDCEFMLTPTTPDGIIPPSKWRDTVRDLKPVRVERQASVIKITTFQGEGLDSRGFDVHPLSDAHVIDGEVQPKFPHWKEIDLYPGIYRFEYIP